MLSSLDIYNTSNKFTLEPIVTHPYQDVNLDFDIGKAQTDPEGLAVGKVTKGVLKQSSSSQREGLFIESKYGHSLTLQEVPFLQEKNRGFYFMQTADVEPPLEEEVLKTNTELNLELATHPDGVPMHQLPVDHSHVRNGHLNKYQELVKRATLYKSNPMRFTELMTEAEHYLIINDPQLYQALHRAEHRVVPDIQEDVENHVQENQENQEENFRRARRASVQRELEQLVSPERREQIEEFKADIEDRSIQSRVQNIVTSRTLLTLDDVSYLEQNSRNPLAFPVSRLSVEVLQTILDGFGIDSIGMNRRALENRIRQMNRSYRFRIE